MCTEQKGQWVAFKLNKQSKNVYLQISKTKDEVSKYFVYYLTNQRYTLQAQH